MSVMIIQKYTIICLYFWCIQKESKIKCFFFQTLKIVKLCKHEIGTLVFNPYSTPLVFNPYSTLHHPGKNQKNNLPFIQCKILDFLIRTFPDSFFHHTLLVRNSVSKIALKLLLMNLFSFVSFIVLARYLI